MAEAHNEAMYAFESYYNEHGLNAFTDGRLSDNDIQQFTTDFAEQYKAEHSDTDWDELQQAYSTYSSAQFEELKNQLSEVVLNYSYEELGSLIDDIESNACANCSTEEEALLVSTICQIAYHSALLWEQDWDWNNSYLIPDNIVYESGEQSDDNKTEDQKEEEQKQKDKEQQEKLKRIAAEDMFGAIAGSTAGPEGALAGAIAASLCQYIIENMLAVAEKIDLENSDPIDSNSYFFTTLQSYYRTNPYECITRYGSKYEGIIY